MIKVDKSSEADARAALLKLKQKEQVSVWKPSRLGVVTETKPIIFKPKRKIVSHLDLTGSGEQS